jgi:5-methylcytosine-specific restriction protein A
MPPVKVCTTPGCPELTPHGACPTCLAARRRNQARTRRRNNDPSMSAYTTHAWRTTRARHLHTHPTCTTCGQPAQDVDHRIPRRILQAAGIQHPDADHWLQALCHPCHSTKTATIDTPLLRRLDSGEDPQALAVEADTAQPSQR